MKCKVCGAESGKYSLCKACNLKKEQGIVIKCTKCGNWHYANGDCPVVTQIPMGYSFLYEKKNTLLSQKERLFFDALKKAVPENYCVFPQINLATFINRTDGARYHNELFRNLDFLITDENFKPRIAVEINDQTHLEKDRRERDEKVKNILEETGTPLLKLWTNYGINQDYINGRVNELLNTKCERISHFNQVPTTPIPESTTPINMLPANAPVVKKKGCYIATCVYGSYDCPQVWTLRRFRDTYLSGSMIGRRFIWIYYRTSPTLIKYFGKYNAFKKPWKFVLDKMVACLKQNGYSDSPYRDE